MPNKVLVYTAISNGYDKLKEPSSLSDNCDYFCFSDNRKSSTGVWDIIPFPENKLDPVRKCRYVKILPHRIFSSYDYSIWIDGNIDITNDVNQLIEHYMENDKNKFVTFNNPFRNCIYEEALECIRQKKDDPKIINKQIESYRNCKFPEKKGLVESNVIIRNHNSPTVKNVMEQWWEQIVKFSRRDQLSFNYVAWKNNFEYGTLNGSSRQNNDFFVLRKHNYSLMNRIKKRYMSINNR